MLPSLDIDLKKVPSPSPKEHPARCKYLLDRVSIPDSPIPYSLKVEVMSTELSLQDDDAEAWKEIARAVSWAEEVLADALETEVVLVSMEVNKALATVAEDGAPLPFIFTIPALTSTEARAGVEVGEGSEALVTLVSVGTSLTFTNTISALVSKQG